MYPMEMMEFMDAGTLGTVVHTVLQEIYLQYGKNTHEGTYVDDAVIDRILVNDEALQAKINETINRIYLHKPDCPLPLTGETVIIATGILMLVKTDYWDLKKGKVSQSCRPKKRKPTIGISMTKCVSI